MYVPISPEVFTAAYVGALAGMGCSERIVTDANPASYAGLTEIAGAYAQAFDTALNAIQVPSSALLAIQGLSESTWESRSPVFNPTNINPATYSNLCAALIAVLLASGAYFAGQGIDPRNPTVYAPVFDNPTADAMLGDGTYVGNYYVINGILIINLAIEWGTTTTIGTSPVNVPLPPGYNLSMVDFSKFMVLPSIFPICQGLGVGVVGGFPAGAPGWGFNFFGFLVVAASVLPFAAGDLLSIEIQVPLL